MFEVLEYLFYQKNQKNLNSFILILKNLFYLKFLELISIFKKSSTTKSKGCCFFIDGTKTNSRKGLNYTLNTICNRYKNQKKRKSPYFLIIIANVNSIIIENQFILKKFLNERGMIVRFFLITNDLKFLNEDVVSDCNVFSYSISSFDSKIFEKVFRISLLRINDLLNKKMKFFGSYQKFKQDMEYLKKCNKKNQIKIFSDFFKISQKFSNEIFVLLIFLNSLSNFKKISPNQFCVSFYNVKMYIKRYRIFKEIS
jgi:hypothetical protein